MIFFYPLLHFILLIKINFHKSSSLNFNRKLIHKKETKYTKPTSIERLVLNIYNYISNLTIITVKIRDILANNLTQHGCFNGEFIINQRRSFVIYNVLYSYLCYIYNILMSSQHKESLKQKLPPICPIY